MFGTIFLGACLLAVVFVVIRFVANFRAAQGTTWQRSVSAAHDSATMLWGYMLTVSGTMLGASVKVSDYLNLPEVRTFIEQNVQAEYLAYALLAIGVVTLAARARTLFSS